MTTFTKREQIVILLFVIVIVGILGFNIFKGDEVELITKPQENIIIKEDLNDNKKAIKDKIIVHISGQVFNEGIVELNPNSRLIDGINKLGGLLDDADITRINLAMKLSDEDRIHIPKINEEINSSNNEYPISISNTSRKININSASKEMLLTLPGIGDVTSQSIIEYRSKSRFKSIEEIKNVSGIGEKKYEKIKELITVK